MPRQFQLEGDSLPQLKARILAEYGPAAQIVDAELITAGGVWGFFARRYFRVTVQVPDGATAGGHASNAVQALAERARTDLSTLSARVERAGIAGRPGPEGRAGLAALLDDADSAEAHMAGTKAEPHVSTGSDAFSRLMNDLTTNVPRYDQVTDASEPRLPASGPSAASGGAVSGGALSDGALPDGSLTDGSLSDGSLSDGSAAGIAAAAFAARAMLNSGHGGAVGVGAGARVHTAGRGAGQLPGRLQGQLHGRLPGQLHGQPAGGGAAAPAILTDAGDLVLVISLGDASLGVARSMARSVASPWVSAAVSTAATGSADAEVSFRGADAAAAGAGAAPAGAPVRDGVSPMVTRASALASATSAHSVHDRRSALGARARGVQTGHSVFVAVELDRAGRDVAAFTQLMTAVSPDQVWVVVDATVKAEDTAAWVDAVASIVAVDAVAATGRMFTATPGTVNGLGLPVVWLDEAGGWPAG